MLLFKISGPALPKTLHGHSSLTKGNNSFIIGGASFSPGGYHCTDSIYILTCINGQFTWDEMNVKLQTARYWFVADFVPN